MTCPSNLALCGVPCGCDGQNPSHYPRPAAQDAVRLLDGYGALAVLLQEPVEDDRYSDGRGE